MPRSVDDEVYADSDEQKRALRYNRIREWMTLVDVLWGMLTSVLALELGLSARLRDAAKRVAPRRLGPVAPYAIAGAVASAVVSLPLSYLQGFVIEHRFDLSNQSRGAWLLEQLKGLAVSLALGAPLAHGAYWVIHRYPRRWWAVLCGLTVPFTILLANLAPVLLMPLFNKFTPLKDRALARRIVDLAASQGVQVSDVLQMDMSKQTKKANAFFTGIGNTKRIVLGDTLLDEFTPDEVEVVLAHELGHQVHRDIWKLIGLQVPVSLTTFYATHRLSGPLLQRFGSRWRIDLEKGPGDVAALPALTLLAGSTSLLLMPVLNAISRTWVEHRADRYALDLTRKTDDFVGAMKKLGRMNLANPRPHALIKYLLYSHPPVQERIAFARRYGSRPGSA